MLDIGGLELLLIAVVALLVIGPERMPEALRTMGLWLGRLRRSFTSVKAEIEKEIGMDEVKRQLHNEAVMAEMKRIEDEVQASVSDIPVDPTLEQAAGEPATADVESNSILPPESTEQPEAAPEPPRPRTEAEVEAAYERKMRAQKTADEDH